MIDNKTPARRKSSRNIWASALAAIAGAVLWLAPVGSPAMADQLASPTGEVLLIVGGGIENTNNGDEAHFDREMLRALGMAEIVTRTLGTRRRRYSKASSRTA